MGAPSQISRRRIHSCLGCNGGTRSPCSTRSAFILKTSNPAGLSNKRSKPKLCSGRDKGHQAHEPLTATSLPSVAWPQNQPGSRCGGRSCVTKPCLMYGPKLRRPSYLERDSVAGPVSRTRVSRRGWVDRTGTFPTVLSQQV